MPKTIYAALDLETTGLDPTKHAICEIGVVLFDKEKIIGNFGSDIYVDTSKYQVSDDALRVNGFTHKRLERGQYLNFYLGSLTAQLGQSMSAHGAQRILLFAHNAPFDVAFLNASEAAHWGLWDEMLRRVIDTVGMAFQYGIGDYEELLSLRRLAEHLLTPAEMAAWKPHTAIGDATATAQCAIKLMRMQQNLVARLAL